MTALVQAGGIYAGPHTEEEKSGEKSNTGIYIDYFLRSRGILPEKIYRFLHENPVCPEDEDWVYEKFSGQAPWNTGNVLCILPGRGEGKADFPVKVPKSGFPGIFCANLVDKCPPQEYNSVLLLNEI